MADTIDALRAQVEKAEQVHEQARDAVQQAGSHLTDHHREVQGLDANLAELDREREVHLENTPGKLEALRVKRRKVVQKRDDLVEEMVLLEARVLAAEQEEVEALAALHVATRRWCHASGAAISAKMRVTIGGLEEDFDMWLVLAREDQRSKDSLLGISSNSNDNGIPTYSWFTAVNGKLAESIRSVVKEKDAAESELRLRERQTAGVV